jgi:hypothetical protein
MFVDPPRKIESLTLVPVRPRMLSATCVIGRPVTERPSTLVMMSPALKPARLAGESSPTPKMHGSPVAESGANMTPTPPVSRLLANSTGFVAAERKPVWSEPEELCACRECATQNAIRAEPTKQKARMIVVRCMSYTKRTCRRHHPVLRIQFSVSWLRMNLTPQRQATIPVQSWAFD